MSLVVKSLTLTILALAAGSLAAVVLGLYLGGAP